MSNHQEASTAMKTAIFFETPIGDTLYSLRYSYLKPDLILIGVYWKDRPAPEQEGTMKLEDLRKILHTFEALQKAAPPTKLPFVEL